MDPRDAVDPRQISRQRKPLPAPHHTPAGPQRTLHLPQHGLQHQPQPQENSRDGRRDNPTDTLRSSPQLGIRRQNQRHPRKRNKRRHGPRLRSNHPNLPRQPRHHHSRPRQRPDTQKSELKGRQRYTMTYHRLLKTIKYKNVFTLKTEHGDISFF